MRINKYIALCGAASRRAADKLVAEGKVTVNGVVARAVGQDIDLENDTVCIGGTALRPEQDKVYIMLNKPAGYLCSCADDRDRKTVLALVKGTGVRIFPVGRLDYDTEGLLLLTNDGDFAYRYTHPKHEVNKKYFAAVTGTLDDRALQALRSGIVIDGAKTAGAQVDILKTTGGRTELYITIHEGKNRQIKKMFRQVDCRVSYLKRVAIGGLELGSLATGAWRHLTDQDMKLLDIAH